MEGESVHRGECGARGEATTVLEVPTTPGASAEIPPTVLAQTGNDGWMIGLGTFASLSLLASGGDLCFVRRSHNAASRK